MKYEQNRCYVLFAYLYFTRFEKCNFKILFFIRACLCLISSSRVHSFLAINLLLNPSVGKKFYKIKQNLKKKQFANSAAIHCYPLAGLNSFLRSEMDKFGSDQSFKKF
ncbi:hypothetical protein BpHYR1_035452 [Brachionus plicatilis]|uniref:Uncharacterized protein n=1 Tax=Brachionus plicatilis TaxID=10195 RepID=A0A3M7SRQ6_BRAPC|nr:hypothetical protein BpHYR1_035452 [Brachionus plicatilis]